MVAWSCDGPKNVKRFGFWGRSVEVLASGGLESGTQGVIGNMGLRSALPLPKMLAKEPSVSLQSLPLSKAKG